MINDAQIYVQKGNAKGKWLGWNMKFSFSDYK